MMTIMLKIQTHCTVCSEELIHEEFSEDGPEVCADCYDDAMPCDLEDSLDKLLSDLN